jgi:hypothetical protein
MAEHIGAACSVCICIGLVSLPGGSAKLPTPACLPAFLTQKSPLHVLHQRVTYDT